MKDRSSDDGGGTQGAPTAPSELSGDGEADVTNPPPTSELSGTTTELPTALEAAPSPLMEEASSRPCLGGGLGSEESESSALALKSGSSRGLQQLDGSFAEKMTDSQRDMLNAFENDILAKEGDEEGGDCSKKRESDVLAPLPRSSIASISPGGENVAVGVPVPVSAPPPPTVNPPPATTNGGGGRPGAYPIRGRAPGAIPAWWRRTNRTTSRGGSSGASSGESRRGVDDGTAAGDESAIVATAVDEEGSIVYATVDRAPTPAPAPAPNPFKDWRVITVLVSLVLIIIVGAIAFVSSQSHSDNSASSNTDTSKKEPRPAPGYTPTPTSISTQSMPPSSTLGSSPNPTRSNSASPTTPSPTRATTPNLTTPSSLPPTSSTTTPSPTIARTTTPSLTKPSSLPLTSSTAPTPPPTFNDYCTSSTNWTQLVSCTVSHYIPWYLSTPWSDWLINETNHQNLPSDHEAVIQRYAVAHVFCEMRGEQCWNEIDAEHECEWDFVICTESKKVSNITLSSKNLSGRIPREIGLLQSLTHLDLSDNELSDVIPYRVRNLLNLVHLDLSHNNLKGGAGFVGNLENLEYLDLSHNEFLGGKISAISHLGYLDINGTQVTLESNKSEKEDYDGWKLCFDGDFCLFCKHCVFKGKGPSWCDWPMASCEEWEEWEEWEECTCKSKKETSRSQL